MSAEVFTFMHPWETFNGGQDRSRQYQNVEFCGNYHDINLEKNLFINI